MASERTGIYANLHAWVSSTNCVPFMPAQVCSLKIMSLPCGWEQEGFMCKTAPTLTTSQSTLCIFYLSLLLTL